MSKTDALIDTVRWCIGRSLDPMITAKLQDALDQYLASDEQERATGALRQTPQGLSRNPRMTVADLVFYAGGGHQNAQIKLNIHGSKNSAYEYIPNRFASVALSTNEAGRVVVLNVNLGRYDLKLKPGKRTW